VARNGTIDETGCNAADNNPNGANIVNATSQAVPGVPVSGLDISDIQSDFLGAIDVSLSLAVVAEHLHERTIAINVGA